MNLPDTSHYLITVAPGRDGASWYVVVIDDIGQTVGFFEQPFTSLEEAELRCQQIGDNVATYTKESE